MEVIDPGHTYELQMLDLEEPDTESLRLTFVKRVGEGYPGNDPDDPGPYPGTILQEVLRACADRLRYVTGQGESLGAPEFEATQALGHVQIAIWLLEMRAAIRHDKPIPTMHEAEFNETCPVCGHVVCADTCAGRKVNDAT